MLQTALDYAARGWRIFPCHSINAGLCSCKRKDCSSPGKHPYTKNGLKDATLNVDQITKWWEQWPQANIAIATGALSNLLVVDIDPDHGGEESLLLWESLFGDFTSTYSVTTGSGGVHLYFTHPGRIVPNAQGGSGKALKDFSGLDIRGDGGYVIAPPSSHVRGKYHINTFIDLQPMPVVWLDALQHGIPDEPLIDSPKFISEQAECDHWLRWYLKQAQSGNRNLSGFYLALKLRDAGVTQEIAASYMLRFCNDVAAGEHPYSMREADASLRSAFSRPPRQRERDSFIAEEKIPVANRLIQIANRADFFHTPGGMLFASIPINGHIEIYPIEEKSGFAHWINQNYYQLYQAMPNATATSNCIKYCQASAHFGQEKEVYTRTAYLDGTIYLDLCNSNCEAIAISASGWKIVACPPVAFLRPRSAKALPIPADNGSFADLRQLLGIKDESHWIMIIAWLVGSLHPTGPYPILCLDGEQGTAKSTVTRLLRAIVDPAIAPTRSAPKDDRDLAVCAQNNWIIALENLSSMQAWLSDALCRVATGNGFATRTLYDNTAETVFAARRPIILNGIGNLTARGDLRDRALIVTMPFIDPAHRKTETKIDAQFQAILPQTLAALCNAVSSALANIADVQLSEQPRMADFAQWIIASDPAQGINFMQVYTKNQAAAIENEIENSPLAVALQKFIKTLPDQCWSGLSNELYAQLTTIHLQHNNDKKQAGWPNSNRQFGSQLTRITPALRATNIFIKKHHSEYGTQIQIMHRLTTADNENNLMSARNDSIVLSADITDKADNPFFSVSKKKDIGKKEEEKGRVYSNPLSALSAIVSLKKSEDNSEKIDHHLADNENNLSSAVVSQLYPFLVKNIIKSDEIPDWKCSDCATESWIRFDGYIICSKCFSPKKYQDFKKTFN